VKGGKRADIEKLVSGEITAAGGTFTIGMIQGVADRITNLYRKQGLVYATCIVPVQDVKAGTVRLELLPGVLGQIKVEGAKRYSANRISRELSPLVGKPIVQGQLETALLSLNDYPGLSVTGVVQPGQTVGQGTLVAKVQGERRFSGSIGIDNGGRSETGRARLRAEGSWNNPLGFGDRLTVFVEPTFVDQGSRYVSGEYEVPLYGPRFTASAYYRYNDYNITPEKDDPRLTGITGETFDRGVQLTQRWLRGRIYNLTAVEGIAVRDADTYFKGPLNQRDHITVTYAKASFDMVDNRFAGINSATLEVRRGLPDALGAMGLSGYTSAPTTSRQYTDPETGKFRFASGQFTSLVGSLERLQTLDALSPALKSHTVTLHVDAQWSADPLVPFEQLSVGGIASSRGYRSGEALFDKGVSVRMEYEMPLPLVTTMPAFFGKTWGDLAHIGLFYDVAYGELNGPNNNELDARTLHSIGGWLEMKGPRSLKTRLTVAAPIAKNTEELRAVEPTYFKNPDARVWFDLGYEF